MSGAVRIIHCAETIKGGIASYLRDLLPLQRERHGDGAVMVVVPSSQLDSLPVGDGVRVVSYRDNGSRVANALRLGRTVLAQLRECGAEIVHVHSTFAGAVVRPMLAAFGRPRRVVYCAHGWAWDRPMGALEKRLVQGIERALCRLCDAVICISEHERVSALNAGLRPDRLRVVVNGIAPQRPRAAGVEVQWPGAGLRLLFVGRFDRQKGADIFCHALAQLGEGASGLLAGGEVLADGQHLALPDNARILGWVEPPHREDLFEAADVLVMPSRWEGFGLTATEAMRASLPVVAAAVGGLREVVVDGETGLLIRPNDPQALADTIASLDGPTLAAMGVASRRRFEQLFSMERVHQELCEIYGATACAPGGTERRRFGPKRQPGPG